MEVSGRKLSDIQDRDSGTSADDHHCDPCMTEGQYIDSFKYCSECQEFLCRNCVRFHQKTKMLKTHQLVDKGDVSTRRSSSQTADICTEICSFHENEIVMFFCPKHVELGCPECVNLDHAKCNVVYIPDKCEDITESDEYRETIKKLEEKIKEIEDVTEKATIKDNEINTYDEKVVEAITKYRAEINDRFDAIQKQSLADADKMKSTCKQKVKHVLDTCTRASSIIKQLQSSLEQNEAAKQTGQLFIALKEAKSKLQLEEMKNAEKSLENVKSNYTFVRDKDIEDILSRKKYLGKLSESSVGQSSSRRSMSLRSRSIQDIKIRTKSDRLKCDIKSIAVLADERVALTDRENLKLKIVDLQRNTLAEDKELDSYPWDVTGLSNDQIAVSLPDKQEILILTAAKRLIVSHRIEVKRRCYGITHYNDSLYVLCRDPYTIVVLDIQGNVKSTIPLTHRDLFKDSTYLVSSKDHKLLYISNHGSDSVVAVTLRGEVHAVYQDKDLRGPLGMVLLDDGSFLACCGINNSIYSISADLKRGKKIEHYINKPKSLCYCPARNGIYACSSSCDQIRFFSFH